MKITNIPVEIIRIDHKNFVSTRTGETVDYYKVTYLDEDSYVIQCPASKEVAQKVGEETRVRGQATLEISPDRNGSSRIRLVDFEQED